MKRPVFAPDMITQDALVTSIRSIICELALDCDGRQRVKDASRRFVEMEEQGEACHSLRSSRPHRAANADLGDLLAELQDINWQQSDRRVFPEFAFLFEDTAQYAQGVADHLLLHGQMEVADVYA